MDRGIRLWDKVLLLLAELANELVGGTMRLIVVRQKRERKVPAVIPQNLDGYLLSGDRRRFS